MPEGGNGRCRAHGLRAWPSVSEKARWDVDLIASVVISPLPSPLLLPSSPKKDSAGPKVRGDSLIRLQMRGTWAKGLTSPCNLSNEQKKQFSMYSVSCVCVSVCVATALGVAGTTLTVLDLCYIGILGSCCKEATLFHPSACEKNPK